MLNKLDDDFEKNTFPFGMLLKIIFLLSMICYVAYHFYNGNYGLKNYLNKQDIINKKNITAQNIEKEIDDIKNKINQLQDNNIDSDLLDEKKKKNTAYMKENEIVIYNNELNKE